MIQAEYKKVIITKRKKWNWLFFKIIRIDWKIFNIVWKTFRYCNKNKLLTIRIYTQEYLPVVINIEKKLIIDNRKHDLKKDKW